MKLTESEEGFSNWMENVDLEEVNLLEAALKAKPSGKDAFGNPLVAAGERLDGRGKPMVLPSRDTGWKTKD